MEIMKDIKILISCHKQSMVPDSKIMLPIEVGADLRKKHIEGILQDNQGENISSKNKMGQGALRIKRREKHGKRKKTCKSDYSER